MSKKTKERPKVKPKAQAEKNARKLGRPPEMDIKDLPKRFAEMKQFLEYYWGRVGLGLSGSPRAGRCEGGA